MKFKDTLLMPNTNFEMKANLAQKEPIIQEKWIKENIIAKRLNSLKDKKRFIVHDGPPYANGDIHVGHAMNKILKDFIVRFHLQQDNFSQLICGWDTHGLPIENAVIKNGINRKLTDPIEFRNYCRQYATEQVNNQITQFSQLGLFTDFNDKYLTLDFNYEIQQIKLFKLMVKQNLVYRKLKPIYWSPSSETALAEAEIEYQELAAPSVYVTFDVIKGNSFINIDCKIIIWTTTPWTLPMNQLLAVGEEIIYLEILVNNKKYLIAQSLLENLKETFNWSDVKIIKKIIGRDLVGIRTKNPLYSNRFSSIVIGHHVETTTGTGIVHIASGFGEDDYLIAQNNNIPVYAPLNDNGTYSQEINDQDLVGIFYDKANKLITERLEKNDSLLKLKFIKHRCPIDWRTKKPVIYRATEQWFINIEKIKPNLLKTLQTVNFVPEWGKKRMMEMITNREDWCISRQRIWGVPIIAFYDENKKPQYNLEIIEHVQNLFIQYQTTDIWFSMSTDELLPLKYRNKNWSKETSIMDVWFDSGTSNLILQEQYHFNSPFDVYLEGMDQFRGWFNSSLITSVVVNGHAPYQNVIAHGFVNDQNGKKMSKSLGNTISPLSIIQQYGSDVLRLWVASVDYREDVKIGPEIMKQISDVYRKIRNTLRFIIGNLFDFDCNQNIVSSLESVDQYILYLALETKEKIITAFANYNFNVGYQLLNNFINNNLSKFYLDFIKDILYVEHKTSIRRRQVQTTIYYLYRILIDLLKPILPYTVEEAHDYLNYPEKQISVHCENYFQFSVSINSELISLWDKILYLREEVNKELEILREQKIIGKSLEAHVFLNLNKDYQNISSINNLHQIFIVSDLTITTKKLENSRETNFGAIKIIAKDGFKCQRCWLIVEKLATQEEICQRCYNVLYLDVQE